MSNFCNAGLGHWAFTFNNFTDFKLVQFASAVSAAIVQTYPGVINFQNIQEVNRIINSI